MKNISPLLLLSAICCALMLTVPIWSETPNGTDTEITPNDNAANLINSGQLSYQMTDEGLLVVEALSDDKFIEIPPTVEGIKVVGLADNVFSNNANIESVIVSDGILKIGKNAFRGCYSLTEATLGETIKDIGDFAFYECTALQTITIPAAVETIGKDAFDFSAKLMSINVADDNNSFSSKDGILFDKAAFTLIKYPPSKQSSEYIVPDGIGVIAPGAFNYAYLLEIISLPDSLQLIGDNAFTSCSALRTLTIPENVVGIGNNAFTGCTGLTRLEILSETAGSAQTSYDDISPEIICKENSAAEAFAIANNFRYSYFDETHDTAATQGKLEFVTKSLNPAWRYFPYSTKLELSRNNAEISLKDGSSLPDGLTLSDDGVISGRPVVWGVYRFTVTAAAEEEEREQTYTLNINTADYDKINSYKITKPFPNPVTADSQTEITINSGDDVADGVYIDGNLLEAGEYVVTGQTVILAAKVIERLTEGRHLFTAEYISGAAAAETFEIKSTAASVLAAEETIPNREQIQASGYEYPYGFGREMTETDGDMHIAEPYEENPKTSREGGVPPMLPAAAALLTLLAAPFRERR